MSAQVRVLRQRVKAVRSTQKTTKAMEMIATSRIAKAQAKVAAAAPYAKQITEVLTALASASNLDHPLLTERETPKRAGILLITSDRGLCGGYNANAIKVAEELGALLRSEGKEPVMYVIGRKGLGYYTFRKRPVVASWTGFSEKPTYADAERASDALLPAFTVGSEGTVEDGTPGIDEMHLVSTHFRSMITQTARARRLAPMEVEIVEHDYSHPGAEMLPAYEFEPSVDALLDEMLPKYVRTRIYAALLDSAASESAARRAACKSATDNANDIIRNLSRQANQARQAQITQELTEIVGGADALAAIGTEED
ncbi:MAG TPA: F0F1 ATP synthase subunit gamma [Nakamurella sp.]|nr:F0F1 ATP synthase subunit gamma [Nakamurella sp.]